MSLSLLRLRYNFLLLSVDGSEGTTWTDGIHRTPRTPGGLTATSYRSVCFMAVLSQTSLFIKLLLLFEGFFYIKLCHHQCLRNYKNVCYDDLVFPQGNPGSSGLKGESGDPGSQVNHSFHHIGEFSLHGCNTSLAFLV